MSLKVGELFVDVVVKGSEKTLDAVKHLKSSLTDVSTAGLAAKAAVLALFYGLDRAFEASGNRGLQLKQFHDLTGMTYDLAQRWIYLGRMSGLGRDEVLSNLSTMQSKMTALRFHEGGMKFLNLLGIDPEKIRDVGYLMGQIRKFALKNADNPDNVRHILEEVGLTPNMIGTLMHSQVDLAKVPKRFIRPPSEIEGNAANMIKFEDFIEQLSVLRDQIVAKYGDSFIETMTGAFGWIEGTISSLKELSMEFPRFAETAKLAALAIAAYFAPVSALILGIVYGLAELQKVRDEEKAQYGPPAPWGAEHKKTPEFLKFMQHPLGNTWDYFSGAVGRAGKDITSHVSAMINAPLTVNATGSDPKALADQIKRTHAEHTGRVAADVLAQIPRNK